MGREVRSSDFSDEELARVYDSIERLVWHVPPDAPPEIEREARAFADGRPRPTPGELREHIEHAVTVARGWDDPDNPRIMLHAAIKSYYLLSWLGHLAERERHGLDLSLGYRVSFTPNFRTAADPDPGPG